GRQPGGLHSQPRGAERPVRRDARHRHVPLRRHAPRPRAPRHGAVHPRGRSAPAPARAGAAGERGGGCRGAVPGGALRGCSMSPRQVTFAINQRPDSRFYFDGEAPLKSFEAVMVERPKSWTFYVDMVTDVPWDVADLAFSHYLIAKDLGKPLTAVPAFQLR